MKKIILIVWWTQEESLLYLINNPTPDDLILLGKANGKIINADEDTDAVSEIGDFLCNRDASCLAPGKESNCKWSNTLTQSPIKEPISAVYSMGMCL